MYSLGKELTPWSGRTFKMPNGSVNQNWQEVIIGVEIIYIDFDYPKGFTWKASKLLKYYIDIVVSNCNLYTIDP